MASPYTTQSISGYNSSPPADDGSKVSMNQVNWSKHKTKLADPVKTLAEAINTELVAAFGKIAFSGVSDKTGNYTILESDQGNLMTHSGASDITFTLLAAATAGSNWAIAFSNVGTGTTTLDGNGSETINGATTITLLPGSGAVLVCDGSNWSAIKSGNLASGNNLSDVASAATAFANIKQAATTSATGVVEKATQAEVQDGTADKYADCATLVGTSQAIHEIGGTVTALGSIDTRLTATFTATGKFLFAQMVASATATGRDANTAYIFGYLELYNNTAASTHTTCPQQYAGHAYYGAVFGTLSSILAADDLIEGNEYELRLRIGKSGTGTFTPTAMTISGMNTAV